MILVHCLHEGRPVCGGPQGLPFEWPENEVWLSKLDWPRSDEERAVIQGRGGTLCESCDHTLKTQEGRE